LSLADLPGEVFIVFSGHKVYARDGSGAIIGPKRFFRGAADEPAGGTISAVTREEIYYAEPPHNQESGTLAYIAQFSLGKALLTLDQADLAAIEDRERRLTIVLMRSLLEVEGIEIMGETDLNKVDRGPVISFSLKKINKRSALKVLPWYIGKALSAFWGVGVRAGFYCAHPYNYAIQGISEAEACIHADSHAQFGQAGCTSVYGDSNYHSVRLSFSFVTREEDLAVLPEALSEIRKMDDKKSFALVVDRIGNTIRVLGQPDDLPIRIFDFYSLGPLSDTSSREIDLLED